MICETCKMEYDPAKHGTIQLVIEKPDNTELYEFDTLFCLTEFLEDKKGAQITGEMLEKAKQKDRMREKMRELVE